MDVEGAGIDVVSGMNTILPKMIFCEKERQHLFKDKPTGENELLSLLQDKGYSVALNLDNDYLFVLNNN